MYAGNVIPCEIDYTMAGATYKRILIQSDLGVSTQRLQALQRANWRVQLVELKDDTWFNIMLFSSIGVGFASLLFGMLVLHRNNGLDILGVIYGVIEGLVAGGIFFIVLLFTLMSLQIYSQYGV